jgi:hypothetical protein
VFRIAISSPPWHCQPTSLFDAAYEAKDFGAAAQRGNHGHSLSRNALSPLFFSLPIRQPFWDSSLQQPHPRRFAAQLLSRDFSLI